MNFTLKTYSSKERFIEGDTVEFYCDYSKIDESIIDSIKWSFNSFILGLNIVEISADNRNVTVRNLNHTIHNDVYFCEMFLKSGIVLSSENYYFLFVECKFNTKNKFKILIN